MQTASAAEWHQSEIARVVTALDGNVTQRALHIRVYNLEHAPRAVYRADFPLRRHAHFTGESLERRKRSRFIQSEFTTEQSRAGKMTQHNMRVSDCWQN